jgi:hypothetical protein
MFQLIFVYLVKKRILNSESLHEVPTQVIVVLLEFDFRGVYCLLDVF